MIVYFHGRVLDPCWTRAFTFQATTIARLCFRSSIHQQQQQQQSLTGREQMII